MHGCVFHDTNGRSPGQTLKILWYFSNEILNGHPLAGLLWVKQCEEVLLELGWEKVPNWECLFVHPKQGLFSSVYVDDIRMAGKKQNKAPVWKKLMKHVDLDEPTSFLDHVYLGCTQCECKPNEILLRKIQRCLNRVFLLEQLKNYQGGKSLTQGRLHGSATWKDMLENASSDTVNWQTRKWSSYTKFQILASMIINANRKNLTQSENYHKFAHKLS